MNIFKLIQDIEKVDPEVYERLNSRRGIFSQLGSMGKKAALAAVPLAFATGLQKAYGRSNATVIEVVNFALTLEYLENDFYAMGNAAPNLIPASDKTVFTQIGKHEAAHVSFLKQAGGTATKPAFDFTAGGTFADVFTNYQTFLAVAQTFEDTGVRAYKGQATELMSNNDVLQAALQIHSVEARHAAIVRKIRGQKSWINLKEPAVNHPAVLPSYNGEENTTQGTLTKDKYTTLSDAAASQAFDEPLTMAQILAIVDPFIV